MSCTGFRRAAMTRYHRVHTARRTALAAVAAVLLVPAAASAASTICVNASGGCTSTAATIPAAVTAAVGGDTIKIGAGVYTTPVNAGTKKLNILGAGAGTPGAAAGAGDTVIA